MALGLRLWHTFACVVLGYSENNSFPPKCTTDIFLFMIIFGNPGTTRNYVGYLKWACEYISLSLEWYSGKLKMTL